MIWDSHCKFPDFWRENERVTSGNEWRTTSALLFSVFSFIVHAAWIFIVVNPRGVADFFCFFLFFLFHYYLFSPRCFYLRQVFAILPRCYLHSGWPFCRSSVEEMAHYLRNWEKLNGSHLRLRAFRCVFQMSGKSFDKHRHTLSADAFHSLWFRKEKPEELYQFNSLENNWLEEWWTPFPLAIVIELTSGNELPILRFVKITPLQLDWLIELVGEIFFWKCSSGSVITVTLTWEMKSTYNSREKN